MKKKFTNTLLALVAVLILMSLFSGCASYPQPMSSDDCLVIIKTGLEKPSDIEAARRYSIFFTGDTKPVKLPRKESSYIYLLVSEPTKIRYIKSIVDDPEWSGDDAGNEIAVPLPYERGKLVIFDYSIVHFIKKTGDYRYSSYVDFVELSAEEKMKIDERMRSKEGLGIWYN